MRFRGMSRTPWPGKVRWRGSEHSFEMPDDDPLLFADYVELVLDDDYGLSSIEPDPKVIVDIGANIGMFSAYARSQFPDAKIHSYEPSSQVFEIARRNAERGDTTIYNEGVASNSGRAIIHDLGSSRLSRTEPSESGVVPLTGFATVLQRVGGRIDLLKVDCEGAEWEFMRDPEHFANVRHIRMEYHLFDGHEVADVYALADRLGFRITRMDEKRAHGIAWMEKAA